MIIAKKEEFDTPLEAEMAQYSNDDPRLISEPDCEATAILDAIAYIKENHYTKPIQIIDYTPYTFCEPARRVLLATVQKKNDGIQTHYTEHSISCI